MKDRSWPEDPLSQIKPDARDRRGIRGIDDRLAHGRLPSRWRFQRRPSWHARCRSGRRPPHQQGSDTSRSPSHPGTPASCAFETFGRRCQTKFWGRSGFEARRRCKNSTQFMLRSTTISIRSAISSLAGLQTTTSRRVGRVARPRRLMAAWVRPCCAMRTGPVVSLTEPSRGPLAGDAMRTTACFPPNCAYQGRDPKCPLYVAISRPRRADRGTAGQSRLVLDRGGLAQCGAPPPAPNRDRNQRERKDTHDRLAPEASTGTVDGARP
jgi:hypothetical protein